MEEYQTDVVIIGAGPVGLFGIFQAGMLGMKVHVVDALPHIGGQCSMLYPEKPIYDIPALPMVTGQGLIDSLAKQAEPFSPHYHLEETVMSLEGNAEKGFTLSTTKSKIHAKAIVIAAGAGAFLPNRPPIKGILEFENQSVFYSVRKKEIFKGQKIVIAGGGDSAVDWALELYPIVDKLYFVHRRDEFKAVQSNIDKLRKLAEDKKIEWLVPAQLYALTGGNGQLQNISVKNNSGEIIEIEADYLLAFYGLAAQIGVLKEWDLEMIRSHIMIEPATARTSRLGIYAVGDIATYENKLKLILTGFSEIAGAMHDAYQLVFKGKALHFEYSTTKGIAHAHT